MEPAITGGGVIVPPDGYMQQVREICDKYGVLLIVDEVICGFGRSGEKFGLSELWREGGYCQHGEGHYKRIFAAFCDCRAGRFV